MTIEELYKLIDKIEKDNLEYKNIVRKRKNKRIIQERKKHIRKILSYFVPLSLMGVISLQTLVDREINNIYNGNNLKITESKVQKIKDKLETQLNIEIKEEDLEDYLLLDAVIKNLNLSKQEKKLICQEMINIIEINPYLNKEQAYQAFLKLKIFYMNRPHNKSSNLLGECIIIDTGLFQIDNIYIYSKTDEIVLEHELIHLLLMNIENRNVPYFLKEGIAELLNIEFFSNNPFLIIKCYPFETLSLKMLCELTSPNTVLKSYTTGNMNILYKELELINPNINAKEFIKLLDNILKKDTIEQKDFSKIQYLINCWEEYAKTSNNIDTKNFEYYLNLFSSLESDDPYLNYLIKIDKYGYIEKTYFNKNITKSKPKVKTKKLSI